MGGCGAGANRRRLIQRNASVREQAGRGFAVSIATWRVYRRPGQPGGSFTGRRNAPAFTSASTPALSGKTVERWVDPLGLHFTKTLVRLFSLTVHQLPEVMSMIARVQSLLCTLTESGVNGSPCPGLCLFFHLSSIRVTMEHIIWLSLSLLIESGG